MMSLFIRKSLNSLYVLVLGVTLSACGGGGGSSGANAAGGAGSVPVVASPLVSVAIVDSSYAVVTTNSISGGGVYYVQATVTDSAGVVVPLKMVTFNTNTSVATLAQATALTNANGIARVQITPVNVTAAVAATATASASVGGVQTSGSLDYQTAAANVALGTMNVTMPRLSALQSTAVSVSATVNGAMASSGQVTVNFAASCGTFSPVSATSNGSGVVSSVYQSSAACSGNVSLTAQANGGSGSSSGVVAVTAAQATNVVFGSATPTTMVMSQATGAKQSTVVFRVLDQSGNAMSGQELDINLSSAAVSAGVRFLAGGSTSSTTQSVTTDGSGNAAVTVTSGTLPTPVQLTAKLHSNTAILAYSSGLTVSSGVPAQDASSLAATSLNIDGFMFDGATTELTFSTADRQGNPVSQGTVVNFVTRSGGILGSSCILDATSRCKVTYTSAGVRPTSGRVVILAFLDGEESFTDLNGDNIWNVGEPFNDIGTMYMDSNENSTYDVATEQTYPGGDVGGGACSTTPSNAYAIYSVDGTCDGTWSDSVRVRKRIVVTLSNGDAQAIVEQTAVRTLNEFSIRVRDSNGNAMPLDTTIAATVSTSGSACTVSSVDPGKVPSTNSPSTHKISLNGHANCATAAVKITVTTPRGFSTVYFSSV